MPLQGYVHVIDSVLKPNDEALEVKRVFDALARLEERVKLKRVGKVSALDEAQRAFSRKEG